MSQALLLCSDGLGYKVTKDEHRIVGALIVSGVEFKEVTKLLLFGRTLPVMIYVRRRHDQVFTWEQGIFYSSLIFFSAACGVDFECRTRIINSTGL